MFDKIVKLKDYQILTLGWLAMLCLVCANCTIHSLFIAKVRVDIASSILWSLQEFGIWLLITPFVCRMLQRNMPMKHAVLFFLSTLAFVFLINTSLDVWLDHVSWRESLFYNWHKHVIAYLVILVLVRFKHRLIDESEGMLSNGHTKPCVDDSKLVSHDAQRRLIIENIDIAHKDIYFAKASGNYVELHSAQGMSLLRITMKELSEKLSEGNFIRCHRSYLVNLTHSEKLLNVRAGQSMLVLNNCSQIPVSKSHHEAVKFLLRG